MYKYKLLFSTWIVERKVVSLADYSLLQAVRVEWRSLEDHICKATLGAGPFPNLHDGSFLATATVLALSRHVPVNRLYFMVGLDHSPRL